MQHYDILSKLQSSFDNALKTGDLLFFPSTVERHTEADVEYQIRLCPALQNKPALPTPHFDQKEKVKFDPFAPPYNANLLVGELTDEESKEEFIILLNKYAVIPRHFLLVTKEFKSQSSPLMPPELVQSYLLLVAAQKQGHKFFGFYNCKSPIGECLTLLPLRYLSIQVAITAEPVNSGEDGPPIELLARRTRLEHQDRPFSLTQLPYASHTYRFPSHLPTYAPEHLESLLADAFLQLLDLTISTIRHDPDYPTGSPSYNVILTLEHLHLIPRKLENYVLAESGDKLSVNALGYAGMLLVKSAEEFEVVKRETVGKILRGVGLASVHELQVEGTAQEAPLAGL
uniref:Uncharacterized protein n=1 Tax=Psilocybe cubensis TaxID=181762 RepID=A0A8H7Y472_PSICU